MKLFAAALLLVAASAFAQAPATKKPAPAPAPKAEAKPAAATGFVANKASMVYHKADCAVGAKIKAENKVTLATKADADKGGYKPCKVCKP